MKTPENQIRITAIASLLAFALLPSCSLSVKKSGIFPSAALATPSPIPCTTTPFAVALEGVWQSTGVCSTYGNTGIRIAIKFDSGLFSQILLMYYGDPTCSGSNPTKFDMGIESPVDAWPTGAAVTELDVSGRPDGLFISGNPGDYGIVYKLNPTTAQYLVTTSTTNLGPTWADWLSGDVDLADFIASPASFVATLAGSVNVSLTKIADNFFTAPAAPTFADLEGVWTTACLDAGDGSSFKFVKGIKSDGNMQFIQPVWNSNTTCTGPVGGFLNNNAFTTTIGAPLGNGKYELDYTNIPFYTMIQKSGEFLLFGTSHGGMGDDGSSIPNRHSVINGDIGYKAFTAPTSASLTGTWISNCLDNGDGTSTKITVDYSHSTTYDFSSSTQTWNSNTTCFGAADTTSVGDSGTYAIGTDFKTGYKVDFHITAGADQYFTVWLDGDYMYQGLPNGDANDASSDVLRSSTFTTNFYYVKQ